MAEYTKLANVEALPSVPDGANAFIEIDGVVKRVPGSGLGGGGVKTAIIKQDGYDNALAGLQTTGSAEEPEPVYYTCTNMTFEEAYATVMSGEPLSAVLMSYNSLYASAAVDIPTIVSIQEIMVGTFVFGVPCLAFMVDEGMFIFWTADGISDQEPSTGR